MKFDKCQTTGTIPPSEVDENSTPFEGPEKLLEIWFAPSPVELHCDDPANFHKCGLRIVPLSVWEEMLDIVKCKILNVVNGKEIDAYLLSESSLFIWPHKLILKTCGRTLNLLGLPRILEIASAYAGLSTVYQLFYSRKSFMFPENQVGPHRDWTEEVQFLDQIFREKGGGKAYTIGKVNGDHWLLYLTGPGAEEKDESPISSTLPAQDYTVEILMSDLSPAASAPFFFPATDPEAISAPHAQGQQVSLTTGISTLFPEHLTTLDAYAFDPCGYSSNALIQGPSPILNGSGLLNGNGNSDAAIPNEGYYTIHVTPEQGYSYASFECNVGLPYFSPSLPPAPPLSSTANPPAASGIPDLGTLVQRVVETFQPGRLTVTLFMSSSNYQDAGGDTEIEAAQKAFRSALGSVRFGADAAGREMRYKRTDKINYEFGGYDLAFATFERRVLGGGNLKEQS